jgi:hypothetical protein
VLELWNLPPAISDGVRYHHAPDAAQQNRESAFATCLANEFAKRIDLDVDLENFDDFAARHREFCQVLNESTDTVTVHDEIRFLSLAYDSLKSAKGLIDATAGTDDTGSGR